MEQNNTHLAPFKGIHSVLYALFQKNSSLDLGAMQSQAELILESGISGINVLGLATEVQKLSFIEQQSVISSVAKAVSSKCTYSVTISGQSIKQQRELLQYALDHGANWVILQPPTVGQYNSKVYLDFFAKVAEGFNCHLAIQNAPQYLGRSLALKDIEDLNAINPHFDIIKTEAPAIEIAALKKSFNNKLSILNGRGGLEMTDCLRAGASGFILAPDLVDYAQIIFNLYQKQEYKKAEEIYAQVAPAIMFLMHSIEHLICYGKRLFGLRAGFEIFDREPCISPDPFGIQLTKHWHEHVGNWRL